MPRAIPLEFNRDFLPLISREPDHFMFAFERAMAVSADPADIEALAKTYGLRRLETADERKFTNYAR